jgi:DNA end-binding protein Ku
MAKRRRTTKAKPRSKFRASWRGQLRFGLVSFEVQAVNAHVSEKAEVHFHLLHEKDHQRIHYAKVCPKHGEVPSDEIVEGFEYAKGKYVEFEKEELDQLHTERERALSIDAFVSAEEIDPLYFDGRMYYLMPSGEGAAEPYALLQAAMEKKQRWAVGQVVFSGREQLVVVRPYEGLMTMAMLNYDAEIRKPAEMKKEFSKSRPVPKKVKLAEDLIARWKEGRFDFGRYKDHYREKVKKAVAAKKKGIEIPQPEEEPPEVINLMEALQQSIASMGRKSGTRSRKGKTPRGRKPAARRKRA